MAAPIMACCSRGATPLPAKRKASSDATSGASEKQGTVPPVAASDGPHIISTGERRWYAVHTYSGYENKVKTQLEARVQTMHLSDRVFQVLVPIEEVVEIRNGERRTVKHKVFPSYILVDMILDDESWLCVKQTPGVTSFVGGASATEPTPLRDEEIEAILRRVKKADEGTAPAAMPQFNIGQSIRIVDGPFADVIGQVSEIHPDRNKLTVTVLLFNREARVELDYLQVEKL
jgi:transcription termination/antitermination protein NusG